VFVCYIKPTGEGKKLRTDFHEFLERWGVARGPRTKCLGFRGDPVQDRVPEFLLIARYVPKFLTQWRRVHDISITNIDDRSRVLENFQWPYLSRGSSDKLRVGSCWGFSGTADNVRGVHWICHSPTHLLYAGMLLWLFWRHCDYWSKKKVLGESTDWRMACRTRRIRACWTLAD